MTEQKRPGHFWERKHPTEQRIDKPKPAAVKPPAQKSARKISTSDLVEEQTAEVCPINWKIGAKVERVPTGIPGFDKLIEGGVKRKSINLVEGGAGTGKTIFCTQFLINGICKYHEPAVYINFEEEKEEFCENMLRLGWDIKQLEADNQFVFIKYAPEQIEKLLGAGGGVIRDILDRIQAKRIVVDSLTSYSMLHDAVSDKRDSLLLLFKTIKKWGCTTLVIGEPIEDFDRHPYNIMDYEVDSVIRLYNTREHKARNRSLEILKMRCTDHSSKTFSYSITDKGIIVYHE